VGPTSVDRRAVIFDMDGVLVDSEPIWRRVEQDVLGPLGVPLDDERCRETMGLRVNEVVAHWYARYPWAGPSVSEVEAAILTGVIAETRAHGAARPGVEHALTLCRALGRRVALASSSYRVVIDAVLDHLGLADAFEVVHSAEHEERGKPDPGVYRTTAARLGVAPAGCTAIEDSPNGVRSAKAAGMACVAIPEAGTDPARLLDADVVLGSLLDLRPEHL
jgi:sugar-phosphatase